MKSDWLKYLYTWLGILVISLPVAIVYWRAIKRGKSARTTAPFVLPYLSNARVSILLDNRDSRSCFTWGHNADCCIRGRGILRLHGGTRRGTWS